MHQALGCKRIKRANRMPNCANALVATILAAAPWACRKRRAQLVYTQLAVDAHRRVEKAADRSRLAVVSGGDGKVCASLVNALQGWSADEERTIH